MFTIPDRRNSDRRRGSRLAVQRKADRRHMERRDSPRIRRKLRVFDGSRSTALEAFGAVSLEGATWRAPTAPRAQVVELELRLPDREERSRVQARIVRVRELDGGVEVDAQFTGHDVRFELGVARLVDTYLHPRRR